MLEGGYKKMLRIGAFFGLVLLLDGNSETDVNGGTISII